MSAGAWAMVVVFVLGLGSLAFVIGSSVRSILVERTGDRSLWREFGLGIALVVLFFATWIGQAVSEWQTYTDEQAEHGQPTSAGDFLSEFGQSTLENWQSEFLQLFAFVSLAALYIHKGSAESKDGEDNIQASLRRIEENLGTLPADAPSGKGEDWKLPDTALKSHDSAMRSSSSSRWYPKPAQPSRRSHMATDVVGLLERDHREVERILASLAESEPGADRDTLVQQLADALSLHMQFEEEHLYPLVEELDAEAAEEASVEHQLAREGLQRLHELVDAPGFGAVVEMLSGGITHHVKDEETKVFPMLRDRADADRLASLANTLLAEKQAAGLSVPTDASKEELLALARAEGIEGRSSMSKEELRAALDAQ